MVYLNDPISADRAKALLSLPLEEKVLVSYEKIDQWYTAWGGNCYVSFSGGKDSTVLAYLAAKYLASYKNPPWPLHLVFVNTGLEYPEIQRFVNEYADWLRREFPHITVNLVRLRPKMNIRQVVTKYGYSIIGKDVAHRIETARRSPNSRSMKLTHPKHYQFCIGGGAYDSLDGLWKPTEKGLGYGRVLDYIGVRY